MREPIAYLNGEWIPFSAARLSVADYGVVQAATVTELIRTFRGHPFRVEEHLVRLRRSMSATGIASPDLVDTLPAVIDRISAENWSLIDSADDLGISVFVTAGIHPMYARGSELSHGSPTVCVHTFPLSFERWADQYNCGVHLVTPSVRAIGRSTIDPRVKSRNRLHWYLADREARQHGPASMALLLDEQGHITETSSGNVLISDGRQLISAPPGSVLGGISQRVVFELAQHIGIANSCRDLRISDLIRATEIIVCSTSYCLLPVTRVNDHPVASGVPGPIYHQLIRDWSRLVEMDIVAQAQGSRN